MIKIKLFFILILLNTETSHANYEKTKWGMSLKAISKLYPNGKSIKEQNGTSTYSVIRSTAGLPTTYLIFCFNSKSKLDSVKMLYPAQGTTVDLTTGSFTRGTVSDAKNIFKLIYNAFLIKYGVPDSLSTEEQKAWTTKDGDTILLQTLKEDGTNFATVAVFYNKISSLKELSKGL